MRQITLFTGGRDFTDACLFRRAITLWPPTHVVVGDASGLDAMARDWARANGIPLLIGVAHWHDWGRRAGPLRNHAMIEMCRIDLVLAFPGGQGTDHCVATARAAGVPVQMVTRRSVGWEGGAP